MSGVPDDGTGKLRLTFGIVLCVIRTYLKVFVYLAIGFFINNNKSLISICFGMAYLTAKVCPPMFVNHIWATHIRRDTRKSVTRYEALPRNERKYLGLCWEPIFS